LAQVIESATQIKSQPLPTLFRRSVLEAH